MVETLLDDVREHLAESSKHIDQAKGVMNDASDSFVRKSKRAVKAGREAAKVFMDDAEHSVWKYPKSAVASGIMTGIMLGFCLGWLLARRD